MAPRLTTRVYKSKTFEQTGEGPEIQDLRSIALAERKTERLMQVNRDLTETQGNQIHLFTILIPYSSSVYFTSYLVV